MVTVSEIVEAYLKSENMTKRELCARMGWSSPNLAGRLKRNSFSAEDWRKVMEAMGYELRVVKPGGAGGILPVGPRVRRMEDKIIYDTATSEALCNNRVDDSDMMFQELYRDKAGRFFIVSYAMWEGGVHQITPIGPADARTFFDRCAAEGDADQIFAEDRSTDHEHTQDQ